MRMVLLLLLLLAAPAAGAQSVRVTSGEHEGFSRLLLTFPATVAWQLGRTPQGYALVVKDTALAFDLSDIYRRISRERLSQIYADPANGSLQLGISCLCHVIPFDYGPRQLVIDIRDGPAPLGSSFETALDGDSLEALGPRSVARPQPRPQPSPVQTGWALNWREAVADASRILPQSALTFDVGGTDVQASRSALLWQLSKAASNGIVDLKNPRPRTAEVNQTDGNAQIRIGQNIDPETDKRIAGLIHGDGGDCARDDILSIADWGRPGPVSDEIGLAVSGLLGEFDEPDGAAVERAVRYLLHLGFGAEARQILAGFEIESPQQPLWTAMAHVLDLDPNPSPFFAGMESCDTAAALWAVLEQGDGQGLRNANIPAILRSFSALPLHLRQHLGPTLADHFLSVDDLATSRAIKDAILRSRDGPQAGVNLLAAKLEIATDNIKEGTTLLETLSQKTGPEGVEATIALAQLQAAAGNEVSPKVTIALEAFFHEIQDGPLEPELRQTLALAYASQNRFALAFRLLPGDTTISSILWDRLAEYGNDSAIVEHAILSDDQVVTPLTAVTHLSLASRLIELGFPQAALMWLGKRRPNSDQETLKFETLRASAALSESDGRGALQALAGIETEEAELLRARAFTLLGDDDAAKSYARTTAFADWEISARQRQSWAELASLEPSPPWAKTLVLIGAGGATPTSPQPLAGPLQRAKEILSENNAAQETIRDLLNLTEIAPAQW